MTPIPQDTTSDAARILERITDAFFALDVEWRFTYINNQAEALWGRARADLLGRNVWDEFPEAVGSTFDAQFRRAVTEKTAVQFEEFYPPLDAWLEVRAYPSPDGLSVFFQNVNERKQAQTRLAEALSAGGIATWRWDLVNDRLMADASLARLFSVSPEEAANGQPEAYLRAIHPDDQPRAAQAVEEAVASGGQYNSEYRITLPDGSPRWLVSRGRVEQDADGKALALPGVTVDITEQVERRRREQFLAELAERARDLNDPEEVIADAVRSVGQFLGVSRCIFADIDIEADTCTVHPSEYRADPTAPSIVGVVSISSFGAFVVAEYAARRAVAVDDVRLDTVRAPEGSLSAYEAINIRAHVTVPVVHFDRIVSCISVHSATPRHWEPEEVDLLRAVVERTWLTVEVMRQAHALAREAEERRVTHERTARILESIADAFFTVDRQWRYTYINHRVEALWGRTREQLLGVTVWEAWPEAVGSVFDAQFHRAMRERVAVSFEEFFPPLDAWLEVRAYPSPDGLAVFFQNVNERKRAEEALKASEAQYRLLLESTGEGIYGIDPAGRFTFVNRAAAQALGFAQEHLSGRSGHALIHHTRPDGAPYPETECPIYQALRTGQAAYSEDDVFWRSDGTAIPVAYTAAPILEGGAVRGVVVTFADISERKALEEERERLAQRERNIAQQLQAALTPSVPERVAGLGLAKYYEAALDEAGVGGDFYDVFPVDKGCTALVVGDLSGKGLAAASQVATVRNMLRYALYRARTLAGALEGLNALLAEQGLLTGFATLFVGAYDSGAGTLTYVNCGQEPALLQRGSGGVELLSSSGPVLGSFEGAVFEERTVTLSSGDALAVFTDGLTEVGVSRSQMLGVEGIADLLERSGRPDEADSAEAVAEHLARSLIAGVDAAARNGVMRDDMCLLVAVAE